MCRTVSTAVSLVVQVSCPMWAVQRYDDGLWRGEDPVLWRLEQPIKPLPARRRLEYPLVAFVTFNTVLSKAPIQIPTKSFLNLEIIVDDVG